jgi:hypothetical protein
MNKLLNISFYTRLLLLAFISTSSHLAHAQTTSTRGITPPQCRVKDLELQDRYVGECDAAGLAHGLGTAKGNQTIYTGDFFHGEKHGHGTQVWTQTGDRYVGQFSHDLRDGLGVYVWGEQSSLKGYQYIGQFKQGVRHGKGIFDWPNGESYAGAWSEDKQLDYYTPTQILQSNTLNAQQWQPAVKNTD